MRIRVRWPEALAALLLLSGGTAVADDFGAAVTTGNWTDASTWVSSGGGIPGASDNVYIGSTYPSGALATATVTLTQNQSANQVFVGFDGGGQGTLDLNGNTLTAFSVTIGDALGTTGVIDRTGGGAITANYLSVDHGNTFTFGASDVVQNSLYVGNDASVTTTSTGNFASSSYYFGTDANINGGTLTLGADLNITPIYNFYNYGGMISVENGGTLDMGGHAVTALDIELGTSSNPGGWTLANQGTITTNALNVYGGSALALGVNDIVANLGVYNGAMVSTVATSNLTSSASISGTDSTLTLGANLNLQGTLAVYGGGTLDAQGYNLTANDIELGTSGGSWTLNNRGNIGAQTLGVANGTLTLGANDVTSNLTVGSGGQVTTTTTGNIAPGFFYGSNVTVNGGTLTLGTDLNVTPTYNYFNFGGVISVENGGTLNVGGHAITANDIELGTAFNPGNWTLANQGTIVTTSLNVYGGPAFAFGSNDSTAFLGVYNGATVSTATTSNVSSSASVSGTGSTLTLGADLYLNGTLAINGGGTLEAQGYNLTANDIELGTSGGSWTLDNRGVISTGTLSVANGSLALTAADSVTSNLNVGTAGTVTLGSDLNIYGTLSINGGTLEAQGYNLTASDIELGTSGGSWTLDNRGVIATSTLGVANGTLALTAADSVTTNLTIGPAGTVTLGADLNLTNVLSVQSGGTLDMGGHAVNAYDIELGTYYNPGGWTIANQGTITATYLNVYGGPAFAFGSSDSVTSLGVYNGVTISTAATSNITGNATVSGTGSMLTLGADLNIYGTLSINGGGALEAQGYNLTANDIELGTSGGSWTLDNRGTITTGTLGVANGSLALTAADSVTTNLSIGAAGTVTLGADLSLTNMLSVQNGGTLDMSGHAVNAYDIELGGSFNPGWSLANQGTITAYTLNVYGGPALALGSNDAVTNLGVYEGAVVSTSATSNVTGNVGIQSGTLTLGSDLNLTGTLSVGNNYYTGAGTLDMGGHAVNASDIELGLYFNPGGWSLVNQGTITANSLNIYGGPAFAFGSSDSTASLGVYNGATVTTSATTNVTGSVYIQSGTLTLGTDLNLTGTLSIASNPYSYLYGSGTLDMGGHAVNAYDIELGSYYNPGGWTIANQGTITATSLNVYGGPAFAFGSGDAVASLGVYEGAAVSTSATSNVTGSVNIQSGTLTLGTDLNLTGTLSVGNNAYYSYLYGNGTLDMGGHAVTANDIELGSNYNPGGWTIANQGAITATSLNVYGGPALAFGSGDAVANLGVYEGAAVSTSATSNITGSATVQSGTLTLGTDLSLTGTLAIGNSYNSNAGTLDMGGHAVTANDIELGSNYNPGGWMIANQGTITATSLNVYGGPALALGTSDALTNLGVYQGAMVSTSATSNITGNANLVEVAGTGSTLTLGADLNIGGTLTVHDGGTLNAGGFAISATDLELGANGTSWTLLNQGTLSLTHIGLSGSSLALGASDSVAFVDASNGATLTTSNVGNITGYINADGAGTSVTLGAGLSLSGLLILSDGAAMNAQGHSISASQVFLGYYGSSASSLTNLGALSTTDLYMGNGSQLTLTSGLDTIGNQIFLAGAGTTLTVQQSGGLTTGLTLNGAYSSALVFDPGPSLVLDLNPTMGNDWIFRWVDPAGGNWVSTLDSLIQNGEIVVNAPNGYQVYDQNGYTYIGYQPAIATPEPSSLLLGVLGVVGIAGLQFSRRRRQRQA